MKSGFLKISLPLIAGFLIVLFAVLNLNGKVFAKDQSDVTICHHTPGNNVTLTFQNQQSYNGHLGTPHSVSTFDTDGSCASTSPSPSPTPSVSPSPSVSPTPLDFPSCLSQNGHGDKAHYDNGTHWVVGDGLLIGRDDVYSIGNQNYLQCYCPLTSEYVAGDEGIQTGWESAHTVNKPAERAGFFLVWGPDFGLDQSWFWATGAEKPLPTTPNFDCGELTQESTPSASPSTGGSNSSDSGSGSNSNSNNNSSDGGQVLGAKNGPQVLAATGSSNLFALAISGFGMITAGAWQALKARVSGRRVK